MVDLPANYVKINPGDRVVMRFDNYSTHAPQIKDPALGFSKTVNTLVMHVSELNGQPADTIFSITSQALQGEMQPYLDQEKYKRYRFTITKDSGAYSAPRILSAMPV